MHKKSDNITLKSDLAIEADMGTFIKEMRLRQGKTQVDVAKEANMSRSTLSLMENGELGTVANLIKVLRVLNQLSVLRTFEVKKQISPLALAKAEQKKRQRATKKGNTDEKPSSW